jgi:hypothetical protein
MEQNTTPLLLNKKQVAQILGVCIKTVCSFVREDGLPMSRVGNSFFIEPQDLLRWIREKRPDVYKQNIEDQNFAVTKRQKIKSQFTAELIGIAKDKSGQASIVRGERFIDLLLQRHESDVLRLTSINLECNHSSEQLTEEPIFNDRTA